MSFEARLLLPDTGIFLDFEENQKFLRASRSIEELPQDSRDLNARIKNNVDFFSTTLHDAYTEKLRLVECELSLIHYLREDISPNEYNETMLFQGEEDDFHRWSLIYDPDEQQENRVLAFVLEVNKEFSFNKETLDYLEAYYYYQPDLQNDMSTFFYIPLALLRSITFCKDLKQPKKASL